jgi:uncharacterized protein YigE (DUF2233 family)
VYLVSALFFYRTMMKSDREFERLEEEHSEVLATKDSLSNLADSLQTVLKKKDATISGLEAALAKAKGHPAKPTPPKSVGARGRAKSVSFKGELFHTYQMDPRKTKLSIHSNGKNRPTRIHGVRSQLAKKGKNMVFACNGGIFEPDYTGTGLYVQAGREGVPLNTRPKSPSGAFQNFYMQPNGVFALTSAGRAYIKTTQDYKKAGIRPWLATQSGPMLVIKGKIHHRFRPASTSKHIRSGVGVLPNGELLFAISKRRVRFYDIADFFLKQGCTDALYLDGAISEMYIPELGLRNCGQSFASVLTVTK